MKWLTPYQKEFLNDVLKTLGSIAFFGVIALGLVWWSFLSSNAGSKPTVSPKEPHETQAKPSPEDDEARHRRLEKEIAERLDAETRRLEENRQRQEAAEQKRINLQIKRLTRVCKDVKDKRIADLTTHDHELISACNSWDVSKIEELSQPTWWDKFSQ